MLYPINSNESHLSNVSLKNIFNYCVYVCICMYISVCVYMRVASMCMCVCTSMCVCMHMCMHVCTPVEAKRGFGSPGPDGSCEPFKVDARSQIQVL